MLLDGIQLLGSSVASNLIVESGTTLPTSATEGELFFKHGVGLYVYDGTSWSVLGSGGGSGSVTLTGDLTGTGTGSITTTLATVNSNVGSFGSSALVPVLTVDGKGRITAVSTSAVVAPSGTLSGTTIAANVVSSSLTSLGTLGSLSVSGNVTSSDPTLPSQVATKNYVDNAIAGLSWKAAVIAATTANITLSGAQTIDGVSLTAGQRVLVKNQTTASQNGIYLVAAGAWTRTTDFDGTPSVSEINGAAVYVDQGTTNKNTTWTETAVVATMGTDPITFAQLSAAVSVAASSLTGSTLASNVVTSSLTSLGTLGALSVSGTTSTGSLSLTGTLSLNSSTGTSGQVLTSQGTSAPIWAAPSVAATALTGTVLASNVVNSALTNVGASLQVGTNTVGLTGPGTATLIVGGTSTGSSATDVIIMPGYTDTNQKQLRFLMNHAGPSTYLGMGVSTNTLLFGASPSVVSLNPTVWMSLTSSAATLPAALSVGTTATVTGATTVGYLAATGAASINTAQNGVYIGNNTTPSPFVGFVSSGATTNQKVSAFTADASGNLIFSMVPDNLSSAGTTWLGVTRSGLTASIITLTSTALNLAVGTGGLQLNGSAGTSGQVLTSNGATAAPTWTTFAGGSSAAGALTGTTLAANVVNSSLTSLGTLGGLTVNGTTTLTGATLFAGAPDGTVPSSGIRPYLTTGGTAGIQINSAGGTSTADNRLTQIFSPATGGGLQFIFVNDANTSNTAFFNATRSGNTATAITLTSTALNLAVGTGGLQLSGSAGSTGQVLTSQGTGAAPTWSSPGVTVLNGTGLTSETSTTGTYVGRDSAPVPQVVSYVASAPASNRATRTYVNSSGSVKWDILSDTFATQATFFQMDRSGSTATAITLTSTAINLAVGTGGLKLNGSAGTAGQVITSQGAAAAPTWTTVRDIPQNIQSAAYTAALTDSGGHILHPTADTSARTYTIPANSAVAFPIGTALMFVNQNGAGAITIAITTDTMRLAGNGSTGSRTLTANGVATALKLTATEWIISGTNLS